MGNDGGSIQKRDELVRLKSKPNTSDVDPAIAQRLLWTLCALSRAPLAPPVVADRLGRMYNKDALLKYLLRRAKAGELREDRVAAYVKSIKDVHNLNLTPNPASSRSSPPGDVAASTSAPAPFVCPLTQRPMNGASRFVYLRPCGCTFSESGLRAVCGGPSAQVTTTTKAAGDAHADKGVDASGSSSPQTDKTASEPCPQCGEPFSPAALGKGAVSPGGDVVVLNPSDEERQAMKAAMEAERARDKERKKAKKAAAAATTTTAAAAEAEASSQPLGTTADRKGGAPGTQAHGKPHEGPGPRPPGVGKRTREHDVEDDAAVVPPRTDAPRVTPPTKASRRDAPPAPPSASASAVLVARAAASAQQAKELSPALRSVYGKDRDAASRGLRDNNWMVRGTFGRYA